MKTAADILREKATPLLVSVPEDMTILEAAAKMEKDKIGAVLVTKEDRIIGIWTERDFLINMLEDGFDPRREKVGDHIRSTLISVQSDTTSVKLEEMFLGLFVRHILIKEGEQNCGVLSMGDVLRSSLLEKDREIRELNHIASWEYYENWAWHRRYEPKTRGIKKES